jgi:hypothetical protein
MTRGRAVGTNRSPSEPRVDARVQELTEMTIGRPDDPKNPLEPVALEAAGLFGTGSRNPSGPAVIVPRQQAEHMIAVNRPSEFSSRLLNPRGRPHMVPSFDAYPARCSGRHELAGRLGRRTQEWGRPYRNDRTDSLASLAWPGGAKPQSHERNEDIAGGGGNSVNGNFGHSESGATSERPRNVCVRTIRYNH